MHALQQFVHVLQQDLRALQYCIHALQQFVTATRLKGTALLHTCTAKTAWMNTLQ